MPTGTPGPTMKTLDQVEARTPLPSGALTATYNINSPGSYYLTGNVTVANSIDAFNIGADNVTLDLNGFTISCTSTTAPSGSGVIINGSRVNVTVRNGSIQSTSTLSGSTFGATGFFNGVYASSGSRNVLVENLSVQGANRGIYLPESDSSTFASVGGSSAVNCRVNIAPISGINAAMVRGCTVTAGGSNGINGLTVSECYGAATSGNGIVGNSVSQSQGESAGAAGSIGLQAVTASNCYGNNTGAGNGLSATTATACRGIAISGVGVTGSIATSCYGSTSTGTGINSTIAVGCIGSASGTGGTAVAPGTTKYNTP